MYLINNPVQNCDFPFIWTENLLRMYTFGGHRLRKQSICRFCRVNHHISTYAPEILCFEFEFLTVHHIVPSLLMKVQKRLACDVIYASAPHADMTSCTWHHRHDITDMMSQTWHHRLDITDMTSQTWHHRLDITDLTSQTWHHRHDIRDLIPQTWHPRLDITDLISQTWHPRLDIPDMTSQTWHQSWSKG